MTSMSQCPFGRDGGIDDCDQTKFTRPIGGRAAACGQSMSRTIPRALSVEGKLFIPDGWVKHDFRACRVTRLSGRASRFRFPLRDFESGNRHGPFAKLELRTGHYGAELRNEEA
jgi:hypothetical protein